LRIRLVRRQGNPVAALGDIAGGPAPDERLMRAGYL
jgi:hypothetical protein